MLVESYVELPLQVPRPRLGPNGEMILTLLTPAGALLDGDAVELQVEVGPGASVVVRQASATQLHRCTGPGISFEAEIRVATDARFSYEPYELIPFADSEYRQTLRIFMSTGAEARLQEVVTPGRLWERFRYRRLVLRTEAYLDGQRILFDAQRIIPAQTDCALLLDGHTHFGSLLHFGPAVGTADADGLHTRFSELGIRGSASLLPCYGIGARVLGPSADVLRRALGCS